MATPKFDADGRPIKQTTTEELQQAEAENAEPVTTTEVEPAQEVDPNQPQQPAANQPPPARMAGQVTDAANPNPNTP